MKEAARCMLLLLSFVALTKLLDGQVTVSEGTLSLPVYDEGPANPNPPFDEYASTKFNYPYPLRDNLTQHRSIHPLRALWLENEYLKCAVLPDLGGHVYTCTDKINGVPMFYENPSIKEASIGMRGGWAAFGLEFNFPVSHSWMTISPVDYAYRAEIDGSASIWIGNVDRVYGMEWTVRLILRPGSTVLEQHVTLTNRADVRHRFYWWSNGGVQVWDDSRITYPMRFTAGHGFVDVDRWPVNSEGKDLSVVGNHTAGPVSRFVYGSREPYMGVWNPKTNAGVVHYADYGELPGKKIWSWGSDADGLDWRRALSDNNSQYVEVQGGLFRNQETYAFLEPRKSLHFTEFWMPTRELGGLSRANLAGAVNLERHGDVLVASLNVNRRLPGARLRFTQGSQVVSSTTEDLAPEKTWSKQVRGGDPQHPLMVELLDGDGHTLLTQTEGLYSWTPESEVKVGLQSRAVIISPKDRTEDAWLQVGREDELNGRLLDAMADYRAAHFAFPQSQSLTIAAGRLAASLLHFDDAITLLTAAQQRETTNPEVAYYLGLAYDGLGDAGHARAAFETAARLPSYRSAANLRLGELDARDGELELSVDRLTSALSEAPYDLRAAEELAAVQQARGARTAAVALATQWQDAFPTSNFLAELLHKPRMEHLAAESDRVLQLAAEFMRLGQYSAALDVLSRTYPALPASAMEPGAVAPGANPLVGYYRAFCLAKLGRPSKTVQFSASRQSVQYVFPSGEETYAVLRWAVGQTIEDATAHFLLGTLQFSEGQTAEGESEWERARLLKADLPGLDADLGSAYLHVEHDAKRALDAFNHGVATDPVNTAVYLGIDQATSILASPPRKFIEALEHYPDLKNAPAELVFELALHQAEAGHFEAAEALFKDRFFAREEGGTNVRQVWEEVELLKLEALAREKRCTEALQGLAAIRSARPGLSFTQDGLEAALGNARDTYRIGKLQLVCDRKREAQASLKQATTFTGLADEAWSDKAARLLPDYDERSERLKLLQALKKANASSQGASSFSRYILAMLQEEGGDHAAAKTMLTQVFLVPDHLMAYHLSREALGTE